MTRSNSVAIPGEYLFPRSHAISATDRSSFFRNGTCLRRIPGLDLREIPDEGQCCGSAGIYNITHRERSMKILEAKVAAIDKTGAERVITSNPGCFMQLHYAKKCWSRKWNVSHISDVLSLSMDRA